MVALNFCDLVVNRPEAAAEEPRLAVDGRSVVGDRVDLAAEVVLFDAVGRIAGRRACDDCINVTSVTTCSTLGRTVERRRLFGSWLVVELIGVVVGRDAREVTDDCVVAVVVLSGFLSVTIDVMAGRMVTFSRFGIFIISSIALSLEVLCADFAVVDRC